MNLAPASAVTAAVAALALSLAACGGGEDPASPDTTPASATPSGDGAGGEGATPSKGATPSEGGATPPGSATPGSHAPQVGDDTALYMDALWEGSTDKERGMACLLFRSEPDKEMGLGEDAVIDDVVGAGEMGLDREGVRDFLDGECPTAEEIDESAGVE